MNSDLTPRKGKVVYLTNEEIDRILHGLGWAYSEGSESDLDEGIFAKLEDGARTSLRSGAGATGETVASPSSGTENT